MSLKQEDHKRMHILHLPISGLKQSKHVCVRSVTLPAESRPDRKRFSIRFLHTASTDFRSRQLSRSTWWNNNDHFKLYCQQQLSECPSSACTSCKYGGTLMLFLGGPQLPTLPWRTTAIWPLPGYSTWWQRHGCVNDLATFITIQQIESHKQLGMKRVRLYRIR